MRSDTKGSRRHDELSEKEHQKYAAHGFHSSEEFRTEPELRVVLSTKLVSADFARSENAPLFQTLTACK